MSMLITEIQPSLKYTQSVSKSSEKMYSALALAQKVTTSTACMAGCLAASAAVTVTGKMPNNLERLAIIPSRVPKLTSNEDETLSE